MLGASFFQVPAIIRAKELGHYVITCDYIPNNFGHKYADEYYNVSTTDLDGVLKLAQQLAIDGIVCYASDPSAPTAAYVAEKMGLPGNPYESTQILSVKDKFRKFLTEHHFRSPVYGSYDELSSMLNDLERFKFPLIMKPVDSSGSKGVSKINSVNETISAFNNAKSFSRSGRVILEEYIDSHGPQIIGDGLSYNGKLVFRAFGTHFFNQNKSEGNPFVPIGGCWPDYRPEYIHNRIHQEIQRLLDLLKMKNCAYNFEVRLDENDMPILMEVGCRNGGNMIPQVLQYATGVDMPEFVIRSALGEDCSNYSLVPPSGFWAYYVVHSNQAGILNEISIDPEFQKEHLVQFWQIKKPGDTIIPFTGSHGTLGTMALKFTSQSEMLEKMENMMRYVRLSFQQET